MRNRKYENFIKENFNPKSKSFNFTFESKNYKKNNFVLLRRISLFLLVLIVVVSTLIINSYKITDKIEFNNVAYDYGKNSIDDDAMTNNNSSIEKFLTDTYFVNSTYDIELKNELFKNYEYEIICQKYKPDNYILQCEIDLYKDDFNITISISDNNYPLFKEEGSDMWELQNGFLNFKLSNISNIEMAILQDSNNYKTKFSLNIVKLAIEANNISKEEFIKSLKSIIGNIG